MTRSYKTALATALVAASLTTSNPAHAFSLSAWWGYYFEVSSGGLYYHPLPKPVR